MATESGESVSGYEVTLDGQTDGHRKYMCPICLVVMRDAVQTSCGHRFCHDCIMKVAGGRFMCKCPVDNTFFKPDHEVFPDIAIRREILSLTVRCQQESQGCQWTGELRQLEEHSNCCDYREVACEHGCNQGRVLRHELERHKQVCDHRPEMCEHCRGIIPAIKMTRHQLLDCQKIPLNCVQCGHPGIERDVIQQHMDSECPAVVIPCRYQHHGCTFKDKRECMGQHEREAMPSHLQLVEELLETQVKRLDTMSSMLNRQRMLLDEKSRELTEVKHTSYTGKLLWKVSLDPGTEKYESPSFFTGCPGYKIHMLLELRGHVYREQPYASLFLVLEKGMYDDDLRFPFNAECKAQVLGQTPGTMEPVWISCGNVPRCLTEHGISNRQPGRLKFMRTDELLSEEFCTNDVIFLDISVDSVL